jgi:protein-disulfide isomerase
MKKLSLFLKKPEGKLIGGIALIIVLLFGYYFYAVSNGVAAPVKDIIVSDTDHVRGALDGKVTLVEFGDFQCPACGAYEPIVRQVIKDNPAILKVVFRHFPLTQIHQNALLAAKASEAASIQGKFWEMHDMLYDNQKTWADTINARQFFLTYAVTLKLDVTKFTTDMDSPGVEAKVLAEYKEGTQLGIQGTPTFFVNGKMIQNPQSVEAFDTLIRDAAK